jgi:class 3 adenylate cyclase
MAQASIELTEVDLEDFLVETPSQQAATKFPSPQAKNAIPAPEERQAERPLKTKIASYYLNKQLEESLLRHGSIPERPADMPIGVGFIDIVDYSYLSSWLSSRENQVFLNGLYTAFYLVLKSHGGYLNKISGDSMMFHFGGIIDPSVQGLSADQATDTIALMLFRTCVDIQKSCRLFNRADESFIPADADEVSRTALRQAFDIIRTLRENLAMVSSLDAMFQVRIRTGAALGEVCIGNFGPEGARQWDVIGVPVIEARRMESTAPIDGIRVTKALYDILDKNKETDRYLEEFRAAASGAFKSIKKRELFRCKPVVLHDKRDARFESCAIQANPDLPEDFCHLVESYLEQLDGGSRSIVNMVKYYRGNRLIIQAFEGKCRELGVNLRIPDLYRALLPRRYREEAARVGEETVRARIERETGLFDIFSILGKFQDTLKTPVDEPQEGIRFTSYDDFVKARKKASIQAFGQRHKNREQGLYFSDVVFPSLLDMLEASLREYQLNNSDVGIESLK